MHRALHLKHLLLLVMSLAAFGCGESQDSVAPEEGLLNIGAEDPDLGKSVFSPGEDVGSGKADSLVGRKGLSTRYDDSDTAVWTVRNQWSDTDTPEARQAGMAWAADSGLTWDEKYSAWIRAMRKIDSESYFETYEMITPYGKTVPAPAVECAETSLFLRGTFASWYGLPFFIEAADREGRIYLGHFGFRRQDGSKYGNSADFKRFYRDYSDMADSWEAEGWPSDGRLRGRRLGGSQDDFQTFLGEEARAGAFFDELYLNKRTGYFMIYLLSYFGSVNLASNANLFHIKPEAVREGDTLLERWKRTGIGHTLVVKTANEFEGSYEVELISGSMPRRQGKWESAAASKSYFTNRYTGGPGENSDGDRYAALGGGLRRWRTPVIIEGRWTNVVPDADADNWLNARDLDGLANRHDTFENILREVPASEKRAVILQKIEDARNHLRRYPASCAARERREDAFEELYELEDGEGLSRAEVDAEYRNLEDFVFGKLVYEDSKTCCWNSTTAAMYEIVMQKAMEDVEDHSAGQCKTPLVFKARDGDYDIFKTYAEQIGRGDEWVAWSEDEPCAQRDTDEDVEAPLAGASWCEVGHSVLGLGGDAGQPSAGGADDRFEPNNGANFGAAIDFGRTYDLQLCGEDEDYFELTPEAGVGEMTVVVSFEHDEGDIDVALLENGVTKVDGSTSTGDEEKVSVSPESASYSVRVYPYQPEGGCQAYSLRAEINR